MATFDSLRLQNGYDLNTLLGEPGIYSGESPINGPADASGAYTLIVDGRDGQVFFSYGEDKVYIRIYDKSYGTWGGWRNQIANAVEDGTIYTSCIRDSAVTTDKLKNGSVTTEKLASNSVATSRIASEAVTRLKIADNAVATSKINDNAVTESKLDELVQQKLNNPAVADGSITNAKLADYGVTVNKIAQAAISNNRIQNGAVDSRTLATNAVTKEKIATGAVSEAKLDSELQAKINTGSGTQIVTGSITLADGAISEKQLDSALKQKINSPMADGSVTTAKLADGSVTVNKIAQGAINNNRIQNGAVNTRTIADGSVTTSKLADFYHSSSEIETNEYWIDGSRIYQQDFAIIVNKDYPDDEIYWNEILEGVIYKYNVVDATVFAGLQPTETQDGKINVETMVDYYRPTYGACGIDFSPTIFDAMMWGTVKYIKQNEFESECFKRIG